MHGYYSELFKYTMVNDIMERDTNYPRNVTQKVPGTF